MHDARDHRSDHLVDGVNFWRRAFAAGEEQVPGPDQRGRERVDVSVRRDAAQVALDGEVGGDHARRFCYERNARRGGLAQPGAQVVSEDQEGDDRNSDGGEQLGECVGEVVGDGARPGGVAQSNCVVVDPSAAVGDELAEEGVEVGEVAVQDALRDARFRGDRPTGQRARPVAKQYPLGGVEELLASVAQGDPGRNRAPPPRVVTSCFDSPDRRVGMCPSIVGA